MILTLTINPSVDRTAEVDVLRRGGVMRPLSVRVDAGGKGVNVSRALHANGVATLAILPAGGYEGDRLLGLLAAAGIPVRTVPIAGAVRANVTIAEADGTTTKLNEPGPRLDAGEIQALEDELLRAAADADWVVLSGSLPPGAPVDTYARLVPRLQAVGARVAVDADGPVLAAAIAAGPDLIKPNRRELAEAAGVAVDAEHDALRAIAVLREQGARAVLASLGHRGAVLCDETGEHHAASGRVEIPRSTVGAGDAALAGFLAAGAFGPAALRAAVTWGAAAVALPGSRMPGPADLQSHAVHAVSPIPPRPEEVLP